MIVRRTSASGSKYLIDRQAPEIAHRRRADQRQHQIRASGTPHFASVTPKSVSSSGMLISLAGSNKPAKPTVVLIDESAGVARGAARIALQHVVDDRDRHLDVGEEIADDAPHVRRGDLAIAHRDRADHGLVGRVVERVHLAVETFPRIVGARLGDRATRERSSTNKPGRPACRPGRKDNRSHWQFVSKARAARSSLSLSASPRLQGYANQAGAYINASLNKRVGRLT